MQYVYKSLSSDTKAPSGLHAGKLSEAYDALHHTLPDQLQHIWWDIQGLAGLL